jgi:trk system potassium uptake protein TrkH
MNFPMISKVLGLLMMIFSIALLPPILVSYLYNENTHQVFLLSFFVILTLGLVMWLPFNGKKTELRARDGLLITVMFWLELGIVGAFPFYLSDSVNLSTTDAIFESISGLTTTGATVISGLDALPKSILYYRQQLQWLGGIGIVVIAIAVMPMLGVGIIQLYRAEAKSDNKLTPRIQDTAKVLFIIYISLTISCLLAYWMAGMTFFDAISHSFSTVAIGGFSTHDASMGFFNETPAVMTICIIFMILSGLSFGLHYYAWIRKSVGHYLHNEEAKLYLSSLIIGSVLVIIYLYFHNIYGQSESIYHGIFQFVSIMTTTGFVTKDFSNWPSFLPFFLLFFSFFGACTGSTGGGLKVGRLLIISKQIFCHSRRYIHPHGVFRVKIKNKNVPSSVTEGVWAFFGVYLAIFYFMVLLLMASGIDYVSAWSAAAASINNLGPGLGIVAENYNDINIFAKWVLCFGMILGRLEIFACLILLTPMYWKK